MGSWVNKIPPSSVAVISNPTVCNVCVFHLAKASCLTFLKPKFDLNLACKLR